MRFFLDQYARHKDQGLDYLHVGDHPQARYHLLSAAKYLLKAAQQSEGELKAIRQERAQRLFSLATSLEDRPPADRKGEPASGGEDAAAKDGLTPDEKWLLSEKPNVRFDHIAGLVDVKEAIRLRVIYPFQHPEVATRFKKRPGGGMLLYGPPGTGKTMIAKAVATELDAQFLDVKSSNIMSQWVGVAERNLARLFEVAARYPTSVIFLDETEALVGRRGGQSTVMNRVIPEFLAQVDGVNARKNCIFLMGATNRPWDIDEAALRTGRFGEKFYVGLPELEARARILHANLEGVPSAPDVDLQAFAAQLEGYSGADIVGVCIRATDEPFRRQIKAAQEAVLTMADLEAARQAVPPTVTAAMLERYRKFGIQAGA